MKKLTIFKISTFAAFFFLILGGIFASFVYFELFVGKDPNSAETIKFVVKKGWGDEEIANSLKEQGIIKSSLVMRIYDVVTFQDDRFQAGKYVLSPSMSIAEIANKFVKGDVLRKKLIIKEGQTLQDVKEALREAEILNEQEFDFAAIKNYSLEFSFLADKPRDVGIEGYVFPDTYQIQDGETAEEIFKTALSNFDKKLSQELRDEIKKQDKTIFDILTMASIIEKEVRNLEDKKIVSGIFWKRLDAGMPLQSCATINYITGKNDAGAALADLDVESPYNTYKYKGLPKGPISNPGLDSIIAAIYPKHTAYWYYLSAKNGTTIFSKTYKQHAAASAKYLNNY